jgi:hypothetical protein
MIYFTVVYQFLCPNCKYLNEGKRTFYAIDQEQASHMLPKVLLPCTVCDGSVTAGTIAETFVVAANDQEVLEIGPAAPRT